VSYSAPQPQRKVILSFQASRPESLLIRTLAAERNSTVSDLLRDLALREARRVGEAALADQEGGIIP
jgi:hypothetical protein